jgi:hypothetical protein
VAAVVAATGRGEQKRKEKAKGKENGVTVDIVEDGGGISARAACNL